MSIQRQQPDGSWEPAQPEDYHVGYDAERYSDGRWMLYRNTRHNSVEVARGRTPVGLAFAYFWRRLLRPVKPTT